MAGGGGIGSTQQSVGASNIGGAYNGTPQGGIGGVDPMGIMSGAPRGGMVGGIDMSSMQPGARQMALENHPFYGKALPQGLGDDFVPRQQPGQGGSFADMASSNPFSAGQNGGAASMPQISEPTQNQSASVPMSQVYSGPIARENPVSFAQLLRGMPQFQQTQQMQQPQQEMQGMPFTGMYQNPYASMYSMGQSPFGGVQQMPYMQPSPFRGYQSQGIMNPYFQQPYMYGNYQNPYGGIAGLMF